MPIDSVGDAMMRLGNVLTGIGIAERRRQDMAFITDMEVEISKGSASLLSQLQQSRYGDLELPEGRSLGREKIQDFVQRYKDQADRVASGNPYLATQLKGLIGRAEMQLTHNYTGIAREKFNDYDLETLQKDLKSRQEAYQYASTDQERAAVMRGAFDAIEARVGGALKGTDAFVMKNKWGAETHTDYVFATLKNMPTQLVLGSMEKYDETLRDLTDVRKYPFLTQGMVNQIYDKGKSEFFTRAQQVQAVKKHEGDEAVLFAIKYMNQNPGAFRSPLDVQTWAEAMGQRPETAFMKSLDAQDMMTLFRYQQEGGGTDYSALIPVMAANSSWSAKKRQVMDLWREGRIPGRVAEQHIARIDSHIDAEKNRATSAARDPVQDPLNQPYLHAFSLVAQGTLDNATKLASSAAILSFYDYRRQGMTADKAFVSAVKDNGLNVSPKALPQVPARYADPEPAVSYRKLKDGLSRGEISKGEFEKHVRRLDGIRELTEFTRSLSAAMQPGRAGKPAGKPKPGGKIQAPTAVEIGEFLTGINVGNEEVY